MLMQCLIINVGPIYTVKVTSIGKQVESVNENAPEVVFGMSKRFASVCISYGLRKLKHSSYVSMQYDGCYLQFAYTHLMVIFIVFMRLLYLC